MHSVRVSARALAPPGLECQAGALTAASNDVSRMTPSLAQPRFRTSQVDAVSKQYKRAGPRVRQGAISDWVCASCSSRFLAGHQRVWNDEKEDQGLREPRKERRVVEAQWFHFKSRKSLKVSLQEGVPGVDEYLRDTERIVHIAFPDQRRIRYLGDGLWRATLKPVTFFTISATPVTDVRTWYEAAALQIASNRVVLDLAGLPPQFHNIDLRLNLRGSLTRVKPPGGGSSNCSMDGSVDLEVGVDLPAPLSFIPAPAVNAVGTAILDGILFAMDAALRRGLVDDYKRWCLEKRSSGGQTRYEQEVRTR